MAAICAVDIGTTRIKAMTFGEDMAPGGTVSAPSVLNTPLPGVVEIDADALWNQTLAVLQDLQSIAPPVDAVVITNQRATVFVVDEAGNAFGPGLCWEDSRGSEELASWVDSVGREHFTSTTGLVPSTIWSLAKILWLCRHGLPAGARFATVQDWLLRRLGAPDWILDHANASLVGLLNLHSLQWDADLTQLAGLSTAQLPALSPSAVRVGGISNDIAAATGLPAGLPLILGGGDQQCASLGLGVLHPGIVGVNLGTAGVVNVPADRLLIDPHGSLVTLAHVVPGRWILEGLAKTYGGAHRWGCGILNDELVNLAAQAPIGSHGLLCLPYFAGGGAPEYDSTLHGALLGLTLANGRADIARAVLEGTTVELVRILDAARTFIETNRIIVSGGGARSRLLLEMLANLAGVSVAVAPQSETSLIGAALLAWVGLGRWPDIAAASTVLPSPSEVLVPDPKLMEAYRSVYRCYRSALNDLCRVGVLSLSCTQQADER